jgi:basic membrane protein A and related proteins
MAWSLRHAGFATFRNIIARRRQADARSRLPPARARRPAVANQEQERTMTFSRISRRQLLQSTGAAALAAGLPATALAKDTVVGFIYVGSRDDYGYNQAHAVGAAAVKKMAGVKMVEEEKVPETEAVEKTMESMINLDGATLLFPTSFGYFSPHVLKLAKKYPKVRFEHAGGLWTDKDPTNAGSYFGYIDEAQHVAGIVAGHATKTGKLGFVAAKPIPQLLRNVNAFILGARLANPNATLQVIFTGDWSMPVKEAEATSSLIDAGVDVITCHVDGPKTVMENAARRGAMVSSYHISAAALAKEAHLTGAEWNWEVLYPRFVEMQVKGQTIPNFYRGGLKEGLVKVAAYGPKVPEAARKQADDIKAKLMAGNYAIYKGPLKDNKGNVVIAAGAERVSTDPELEKMNYLVEGVIGATS